MEREKEREGERERERERGRETLSLCEFDILGMEADKRLESICQTFPHNVISLLSFQTAHCRFFYFFPLLSSVFIIFYFYFFIIQHFTEMNEKKVNKT